MTTVERVTSAVGVGAIIGTAALAVWVAWLWRYHRHAGGA